MTEDKKAGSIRQLKAYEILYRELRDTQRIELHQDDDKRRVENSLGFLNSVKRLLDATPPPDELGNHLGMIRSGLEVAWKIMKAPRDGYADLWWFSKPRPFHVPRTFKAIAQEIPKIDMTSEALRSYGVHLGYMDDLTLGKIQDAGFAYMETCAYALQQAIEAPYLRESGITFFGEEFRASDTLSERRDQITRALKMAEGTAVNLIELAARQAVEVGSGKATQRGSGPALIGYIKQVHDSIQRVIKNADPTGYWARSLNESPHGEFELALALVELAARKRAGIDSLEKAADGLKKATDELKKTSASINNLMEAGSQETAGVAPAITTMGKLATTSVEDRRVRDDRILDAMNADLDRRAREGAAAYADVMSGKTIPDKVYIDPTTGEVRTVTKGLTNNDSPPATEADDKPKLAFDPIAGEEGYPGQKTQIFGPFPNQSEALQKWFAAPWYITESGNFRRDIPFGGTRIRVIIANGSGGWATFVIQEGGKKKFQAVTGRRMKIVEAMIDCFDHFGMEAELS